MRSMFVATLLAATTAVPAFAQDATAPATGFRVEGIVGADQQRIDGGHHNGLMYGVGAGYDVQVRGPSGPIFGLEGEVDDSNGKLCSGSATAASPRMCQNGKRDIYVGGRIAAPTLPNLLLYAKAGYVNGRFSRSTDNGTGVVNLGAANYDGWRIGGGAEYTIAPKMFVKAELRLSNYQDGFSRRQAVAGFGMRF